MSHAFANVDRKTRGAERRIFRRRRVRSLAYVELGQGNGGIVLNVSEGGLAVQAVMGVAGDELPDMRLQLAHSNKEIRTKGRVTWTGEFRKLAGIEFVDLSVEALRQIREWIALEEPEERPAEASLKKTHEAIEAPIEFPPHLEIPNIVPASSVTGTSPEATRETKSPREVTLPRRTSLSAQERASILRELESGKEMDSATAELSVEIPSTGSAPSASPPSARSAAFEDIPSNIDRVKSEPASPAPAISGMGGGPQHSSSLPADRYGFKSGIPSPIVEAPKSHKRTAILVGSFAIVSLGVGWMAGRAGLRGMFESSSTSEQKAAPQAAVAVAPVASPSVSEIEVIDARNQRWLIPFQSPSGEPAAGASASSASGAYEARTGTSSAGADSQGTGTSASSNLGDATALPLVKRSEAPVSIVPGSNQTPSAAGDGLVAGELVHRVEPEYPADALAQGIEGAVKLDAVIDPDGNVKTLQPISGPKMLLPAAMDAVHQWRYSPAMLNGRPIQTERQITITFQLSSTVSK